MSEIAGRNTDGASEEESTARRNTIHSVTEADVKLFGVNRLNKPLEKLTTLDQSLDLVDIIDELYATTGADIYRYDLLIPRSNYWHGTLHLGMYSVYGSRYESVDADGVPTQCGEREISDSIHLGDENEYARIQKREARTGNPNDPFAETSLIVATQKEVKFAIRVIHEALEFAAKTNQKILYEPRFDDTFYDPPLA
jgi:hypothetical protein